MAEAEFVNGLVAKQPHPNAPDFVKAKISIKREDLLNWLQEKNDEWINIDIKESKTGNWYAQVDTWQPNNGAQGGAPMQGVAVQQHSTDEDIPLPDEPHMSDDDFDIDLKDTPF